MVSYDLLVEMSDLTLKETTQKRKRVTKESDKSKKQKTEKEEEEDGEVIEQDIELDYSSNYFENCFFLIF